MQDIEMTWLCKETQNKIKNKNTENLSFLIRESSIMHHKQHVVLFLK